MVIHDHDLILTFTQLSQAMVIRSEHHSFFMRRLFSNKLPTATVLLTPALQFMVVYVPFLQPSLRTVSLPGEELALCIGLSTLVFWGVELEKWLIRRGER